MVKKRKLKQNSFTNTCVFVLLPLLYPSIGGRTEILSSECMIYQIDLTDWMSFLLSNSMEEISPYPDVLNAYT